MKESESEVTQLCPNLRDPMDCSLPGSSIHGIFEARVLEWGAIAFSVSSHYVPPNTLLLFNIIHYYVDVQIMPNLAGESPSFSFSVPLTHSVGSETS